LRKARKYREADLLRERILRLGYSLDDTPKGTKVKKLRARG
jgi:cysteinyl-tRNA synthetase